MKAAGGELSATFLPDYTKILNRMFCVCNRVLTIIVKKQFPKLNSRPMPQKGVHVWNIGFIRTYKHIRKII